MRDIARIDKIVDEFRELWHKYPDLRLGQLMEDFIFPYSSHDSMFYQEDDETLEKLKELNKKGRI